MWGLNFSVFFKKKFLACLLFQKLSIVKQCSKPEVTTIKRIITWIIFCEKPGTLHVTHIWLGLTSNYKQIYSLQDTTFIFMFIPQLYIGASCPVLQAIY